MTRIILETDDNWTKRKIVNAINTETSLLKRVIQNTQDRLKDFEAKYGRLDRDSLYGKVDDMELLEWEGEMETMERLKEKIKSLEEIVFDYR